MSAVATMIETHPGHGHAAGSTITRCIDAASECVAVCTLCADACLDEPNVAHLRNCIRANLSCADICDATARTLGRLSDANVDVVRVQVEACKAACTACAAECEEHSSMHMHCKECAQVCRLCEECCDQLARSLQR